MLNYEFTQLRKRGFRKKVEFDFRFLSFVSAFRVSQVFQTMKIMSLVITKLLVITV
jgi:hypothetical protein